MAKATTIDGNETISKIKRRSIVFSALLPYLYIAPAFVPMLIFTFWAVVFAFVLSFLDWNLVRPEIQFVGLDNYVALFNKELFWIALVNTFKYLFGLLPLHVFLPMALAVLLLDVTSERIKTIYKVTLFSPTVLSFAVAGMVFLWIYHPSGGLLNRSLNIMGLPTVSWLSDSDWALWAIVLVTGWKLFGYNLILFFAALSNIPPDYIEAAQIDGASKWQIFWKIVWPLLSPTTFFVFVTTMIYAAERSFIPINMLTRGGPFQTTTNLVYAIYEFAFKFFDAGVASAASTITFVIFLLITFLQIRYLERFVHYEA